MIHVYNNVLAGTSEGGKNSSPSSNAFRVNKSHFVQCSTGSGWCNSLRHNQSCICTRVAFDLKKEHTSSGNTKNQEFSHYMCMYHFTLICVYTNTGYGMPILNNIQYKLITKIIQYA